MGQTHKPERLIKTGIKNYHGERPVTGLDPGPAIQDLFTMEGHNRNLFLVSSHHFRLFDRS